MAFELKRRGHDVTVMTAIPDYPKGKFFEGYGVFKRRKELIKGVKIYRSLIIPRGKGTSLRLALNYLSYTVFSALQALWLGISRKFDTIIVHETSPVMVGIPAIIIKKIQKISIHFWVLDLWPESLSAAGGITNKYILSSFERLTRWIYNNSKTILIGSRGYQESINQKGDYKSKIHYFPNWIDKKLSDPPSDNLPILPDGFNIVFTGNMGDAQDFPHIIDCAKKLAEHPRINFIIVGDGRKKPWVDEQIKIHGIHNVRCVGRFRPEDMTYFYERASVLFLALKDEPIFSITAPAKLQAYMSSGRPIVAMINGESQGLIHEADCGWCVPAENSNALAELILELSKTPAELLNEKGINGMNYSKKHFDFTNNIDRLESFITQPQ